MRVGAAVLMLSCFALAACGIAFDAGTRPAHEPAKFQDVDNSPTREEKKQMGASPSPTFGLSLVVGGARMDAGSLPKPPIPVIASP